MSEEVLITDCCDINDIELCDVVASLPVQYQHSTNLHDLFITPLINQINCINQSLSFMCNQSDCSELSGDALTAFGSFVGFEREQCNAACNIDGFVSIDDDDLYCRFIQMYLAGKAGATTSVLCEALTCFFGDDARILTSENGLTEIAIGRDLTDVERMFVPLIERVIPHTCGTEVRLYVNDASTNFDVDRIFGINCEGCDVWDDELCGGASFLCGQLICGDPPVVICPSPPPITVGRQTSIQITNTSGEISPDGWTVTPDLPDGLSIRGIFITGTISETFPTTTFTLTARNPNGESSCEITLSSRTPVPVLTCFPERIFRVGVEEQFIIASNVGGNDPSLNNTWSVSPALPAGLVLDTSTGELTGTPVSAQAQTTYTVTLTNTAGTDSCDFELTILDENLPCTGAVSCTGEQVLIDDGLTVMTGVGTIPDTLTSIGSCSGDISGISVLSSVHFSDGEVSIGFNAPIPANWTSLIISGSGNTETLDITGFVGQSSILTTPPNSFAYSIMFDGDFTIEANCA